MEIKIFALILFLLTYLSIILFFKKKTIIVWLAVFAFLITGILSPKEAWYAINWNVMGIYVGMLFISESFIYSKTPEFLGKWFTNKSKNATVAMVLICALSGILSIFMENVAIVLIVAPIALSISRKLNINPVPLIIGVAVSSNLQGVATLIGDPPSLLLASHMGLGFNDFFVYLGKPSLFFAVQVGAIASLGVLWYFLRNQHASLHKLTIEKPKSPFPTLILVFMVIALAISSSFSHLHYLAGAICMLFGMFALLWIWFAKKENFNRALFQVDWETGFFLIGIFIVVEVLTAQGLVEDLALIISGIVGSNVFIAFNIIVWMSILISAFIDNVPYITAMLPIVSILSDNLGLTSPVIMFGLVLGASVGGNVSPIGASANVVATGILKKEGRHISFMDFAKIGIPFTLVATFASSMFIWVFFGV